MEGSTAHDDELAESVLPAGAFSGWLHSMTVALQDQRGPGSEVPCGSCTACCASAQFVHIEPDETETLDRIPIELLFPAPLAPSGHVLLGYDEHGRCPMLIDNRCSIYEHRPRTCRTYDCRVFAAAGIEIVEKPLIAERARRWRFDYSTELDRVEGDAVRAASRFVDAHPDLLPEGSVPVNTTQHAVLAVEIHEAFVRHDPVSGVAIVRAPDVDEIRGALNTGAPPDGRES